MTNKNIMEMTNKRGRAEYNSPVFNSIAVAQQFNICYSEQQNSNAYSFDAFSDEDSSQQLKF